MKSKELYKYLRKIAEIAMDREHTKLFISEAVSSYIKRQVRKMIEKDLDDLKLDYELGVVTESEYNEELSILKCVERSL